MQKILLAIAALMTTQAAFAGHNLKSVQDKSAVVADAIAAVEATKSVICDTVESVQVKADASSGPNTWRQIAFCYKDGAALVTARTRMQSGVSLRSMNNVEAVLDITYTVTDVGGQRDVELKSISLK